MAAKAAIGLKGLTADFSLAIIFIIIIIFTFNVGVAITEQLLHVSYFFGYMCRCQISFSLFLGVSWTQQ